MKLLKRGDKYTIQCSICNKIVIKTFYSLQENICSSCKRKKTNLEKYGVENPSQSNEIQDKIKINNIKKYGVESTNQIKEIKEKKKKISLEKYGVENPSQSNKIQDKIKQTKLSRYGNKSYNNSEQTKLTNLEKYGMVSLLSNNKEYMCKKYGVSNSSYLEQSLEKRKQTNLDRYGVENAMQCDIIREQVRNSSFVNVYNNIINLKDVAPIFTLEEYKLTRIHQYSKFKWLCKKCHTEFEDYLANGIAPRCPICFPKLNGYSNQEKEVADYCKSLGLEIIENDRQILNGLEIDIYIPDCKLAIEYNGIYWHSVEKIKDKYYHQNKIKLAHEKGIRLLHIWEHEWEENKELIQDNIEYYINNLQEEILPKEPELHNIYDNLIWI